MKFAKTPLVAAALAAVLGASALGAGAVSAAGNTAGTGPFADLAQAIATHFNVDATEVQTLIDAQLAEHKEERHADMAARATEGLAKAVSDGQLTQAQADALIAHRAEMEATHEEWRTLTPEERRTKMEEHRTEMDAWLDAQGIDKEVLHDVLGGPGPHGPRGGHGPRNRE
jgi:hypothetical protein